MKRAPSERKKYGARLLANIAQQYGFIEKQPCEKCGFEHAEKHHDDYDKPLDIRWLCRLCHTEQHEDERAEAEAEVVAVLKRFLMGA